MNPPRIGLVTIAHGRHQHLLAQQRSLAAGVTPPVRVVVAIADPDVAPLVPDATVVGLDADPEALPLAAARNAGAREAIAQGADRLVFLDVDCLVGPETIAGYAAEPPIADGPDDPGAVWCGPVTYLRRDDRPYDLSRLPELDHPHPARPDPGPGHSLVDDRWELFWSLSFALDVSTWNRLPGFDERYLGYGAEDTDFAQRARAAGCSLVWTGSARAYHQWHPSQTPPVGHRHDIVRNANLFHDRWGWWPMTGWLEGLRELGLVGLDDADDGRWVVRA